ncbi:MAG: hypothetical protein ACLP8A_17065 [Methylovirgula sp.]
MSDLFDISAVEAALAARAEELRAALEQRIQQKLSGEVLAVRSGALLNSIASAVDDDADGVSIAGRIDLV